MSQGANFCLQLAPTDPAVVTVLLICSGLSYLTFWVLKYRNIPGNDWFLMANIAMMWWLLTTAFEISAQDPSCKLWWGQIAWPGIMLMPTAWAMFLYEYAQAKRVPALLKNFAVFGAPVVFSIFAATNGWHHLFYGEGTQFVVTQGRGSISYEHALVFFVAIAYNYVFVVGASIIAGCAAFRADALVRSFFIKLLAITFMPVVVNILYIGWGVTLFGIDPTPFMFAVSLSLIVWLIADNRWVDVNAMARELMFFNATDPIFVTDTEGRLYGLNPEASRVFGEEGLKPGANLQDHEDFAPLLGADWLSDQNNMAQVITRGQRSFEARVHNIDFDPARPRIGRVIALIDVTAQQKAMLSMRDAAERARAADLAKSQFLATVSHELRTPLTVIKGALDLMSHKGVSIPAEKVEKLLAMALDNANSLATLVDDLLVLQKVENLEFSFELETVDIEQLCRDSNASMGSYLTQKSVTLELDIRDENLLVQGDRKRLKQVLANILSNAIKFSRPNGVVLTRLERVGDLARISIKDDGIGIPQDAKEKVFGRFTQVDSSDSRNTGGSGLGMHITKQIVTLHGATIDYVSAPDQGTTFIVDIPLMDPAENADQEANLHAAQ